MQMFQHSTHNKMLERGAHVYELDVVEIAVCDSLINLLVLPYPVLEILQRLQ